MLVLTRKIDESIMIGDSITITVLSISRGNVRIGIDAPREIAVNRDEIYDLKLAERRAEQKGRVDG